MGRPKLLQLGKYFPPALGGMERHLLDQCLGLAEHFEIDVVVANSGRNTVQETVNGLRVTRVANMGEMFATPLCPTLPFHIRRLSSSGEGLIHIHVPNPMAHASYGLARPPGRLLVTWHSDIVDRPILDGIYRRSLFRLLERAHLIIATSPGYVASSPYLKEFPEKCVVIPPSVDLDRFQATDPTREGAVEIRNRYGGPLVLFVGRLVRYKGLDTLLAAAPTIDGRILIVGDGPQRARVRGAIHGAGLGGRVTLLGNVPDEALPAFYHACDVFVLPSDSRSEAFGIVQLEAMASARPVVSTRLDTGVPWVNRHGATGLVVPPRDPYALAAAVNRLLADEAERTRFGESGRAHVASSFSREIVAGQTVDVFRGAVLGQSPGP